MKQGASAAIWWHNQCLLIKRGKAPYKDHWSFPGGTVEEGESLADALIREIQEEVGLTLSKFKQIAEQDFRKEGLEFYLTIFVAVLNDKQRPDIIASSDAVDHCWVIWDETAQRFEGMPELVTPNLMGYLKVLKNIFI